MKKVTLESVYKYATTVADCACPDMGFRGGSHKDPVTGESVCKHIKAVRYSGVTSGKYLVAVKSHYGFYLITSLYTGVTYHIVKSAAFSSIPDGVYWASRTQLELVKTEGTVGLTGISGATSWTLQQARQYIKSLSSLEVLC